MVLVPATAQAATGVQASTASPGTLSLLPGTAVAGDTADAFGFVYSTPGAPTAGTVTINVPAGFSRPQVTTPRGSGYLASVSTCSTFDVTGVISQPDGSSTVAIAVNCARQRIGIMTYLRVAVPTVARGYAFASTYAPSGSASPVAFSGQRLITVKPGPLAHLTLSPATATITPGAAQAYTAQGADAFGNALGDATAATTFSITPDGSCSHNLCSGVLAGPHTVTGTDGAVTATAALAVSPPATADLSITESTDQAAPAYGTAVTFTTTVTNLSGTTAATGVTTSVAVPGGLTSPTADSPGYDAATGIWTVGTLAAGASATLHITGSAGDVALGIQKLTATVQSGTADPNPANNTASAGEASVPAPVKVLITPSPANPANIDIGLPGEASWTATAVNADNSAAPAPAGTIQWSCYTGSGNPCPPAHGTDFFNIPTLTYTIQQLNVDAYTLVAQFTPMTPITRPPPLAWTAMSNSPPPTAVPPEQRFPLTRIDASAVTPDDPEQ